MARRQQASAKESSPETGPNVDQSVGPSESTAASEDVFDQAIAARQTEEASRKAEEAEPIREPSDATQMEPAARNGITRRQYQKAPDPRGIHTIMLSEDPKGPKARLLRSNDNQAMLIQFSQRPDAEILSQLREAGFRWENRAHSDFATGAWIIELEQGNEWRNHANAEKVFQGVVNDIRERNGMEPFVPGAGQNV